ncbi:hypothetical protein ACWATR_00090 [Nostoc sp. UIC 10890]
MGEAIYLHSFLRLIWALRSLIKLRSKKNRVILLRCWLKIQFQV